MSKAEQIYEKLKGAPEDVVQEVLDFIGYLESKKRLPGKPRPRRSMRDYEGCLKDSKAFAGDPVEIQRKLRAEWDREWDK